LTNFHLAYIVFYSPSILQIETIHLLIYRTEIRTTTPSCPLANGPNPINFYVYLVTALCTIVCNCMHSNNNKNFSKNMHCGL
jgi:hypothetical protein